MSRELQLRIVSGVAVAVIALLMVYWGSVPFAILVFMVSAAMSWEWGGIVRGEGLDTAGWLQISSMAAAAILCDTAPEFEIALRATIENVHGQSRKLGNLKASQGFAIGGSGIDHHARAVDSRQPAAKPRLRVTELGHDEGGRGGQHLSLLLVAGMAFSSRVSASTSSSRIDSRNASLAKKFVP